MLIVLWSTYSAYSAIQYSRNIHSIRAFTQHWCHVNHTTAVHRVLSDICKNCMSGSLSWCTETRTYKSPSKNISVFDHNNL